MKPELIKFVSGTKAKASEINENFDKLLNHVIETEENDVRVYKPDQEFEYGKYVLGEVDGIFGIYKSVAEENKGNPLTDENYWVKVDLLKEFDLGYYLNKSQITNCLLEVPQNIQYTFADNTLTFLKGSKYTMPNGSGVFEERVMSKDVVYFSGEGTGTYMLFVNTKEGLNACAISRVCSGTTDTLSTTTYHAWYDTTNNIIKRYDTDLTTPAYQLSLPIMIITMNTGTITSIDQIFNGFGYIGSHFFVDKGVKGLIPDGRNEDGTYKNIEYVTDKVITYARNLTYTNVKVYVNAQGSLNAIGTSEYDEDKNENWIPSTSQYFEAFPIATCDMMSGVISNFRPKLPFRAVDYNDFAKVQNTAIGYPDYTKGITKSWDTEYTADVDGWVTAGAWVVDAGPEASLVINGVNLVVSAITGGTVTRGDKKLYPIKKGWTYKATGGKSNKSIIFYPCI